MLEPHGNAILAQSPGLNVEISCIYAYRLVNTKVFLTYIRQNMCFIFEMRVYILYSLSRGILWPECILGMLVGNMICLPFAGLTETSDIFSCLTNS